MGGTKTVPTLLFLLGGKLLKFKSYTLDKEVV